ncbi:Intraflagellar transport protein 88, partial [Cladochytrium tenue]
LVNKRLGLYADALQCFEKLHSILRSSAEVMYQIADIYDRKGSLQQSMEWYNILISVVPTDPGVLARLGDAFVKEGDKSQAFQHYSESYRYFPSNLDVISWLGAYYVDCEVYEHAVQFFERAALIQPGEIRWRLMVASCHRRSGSYQLALDTYRAVHARFPDSVECLRLLVRICTDLGLKEVHEYVGKLSRLEKERGGDNVGGGGGDGGREDTAGSRRASGPPPPPPPPAGVADSRAVIGAVRPKTAARKAGAGAMAGSAANGEEEDWTQDVEGLLPD